MAKHEYDEETALSKIKRNKVKVNGKHITIPAFMGLKLWGAVSYLCRVCKYTWTKEEVKA